VEGVTLGVAAVASLAVMMVRPVMGLIVFLVALAWYPQYLAVDLGGTHFTVSRIVILAVYLKVFTTPELVNRFRWCWLDRFVLAGIVLEAISGLAHAEDVPAFLNNRAGAAFDTVLPYFAARLVLTSKADYLTLVKSAVIVAAPLAVFGAYQSVTGHDPLGFLSRYSFVKPTEFDRALPARSGFWRAEATMGLSISFGLFFAILGAWAAGLWNFVRARRMLVAGLGFMVIGLVSSMSSGPILAGLMAILFMAAYPLRRYWKTGVAMVVVAMVGVEILSNRHWYGVWGDFTFDASTAWYRTRLIEVALGGGMSGHWLMGFGYAVDPGWGPLIDGRGHTDVVNHFILLLVRFGLIGLAPFVASVVAAGLRLRRAFQSAQAPADRWLIWTVASCLFGVVSALFSVSLMAQPTQVFYMTLGFCGAAPVWMWNKARAAVVHERAGAASESPRPALLWGMGREMRSGRGSGREW
jgi:hypothetical protein